MKLDIIMHYEVDETSGEVKFIGKEEVSVDTAKKATSAKKSSSKILGGDEPLLVLDSNKYSINEAAAKALGVEPGETVHINYPKKDKKYVPAIGASKSFGVKAGNKLTQSLTVSYRGSANEKLSEFGTTFTFEESSKEGIFYLKGDKPPVAVPEEDEVIKIDEASDLEDLNDVISEDNGIDLSDIDLTL